MNPSWYCGPAAGQSGFGPPVCAMNVGRALPGLAAPAAAPAAAVGAAGADGVHAARSGNATPPAIVTMNPRRLSALTYVEPPKSSADKPDFGEVAGGRTFRDCWPGKAACTTPCTVH